MASEAYEGWAILELMGHRRLGGYVTEVQQYGVTMCRIDVPSVDGTAMATQFYGGASIYGCTPTSEEIAKAIARGNQPAPVHRWELPPATTSERRYPSDDDLGEEEG